LSKSGLEVCGAGAGKISQTPAGLGLNFACAGREQTENFNPYWTLTPTK